MSCLLMPMIAYRALVLLYNNRPKGSTMRLGDLAGGLTAQVEFSIPLPALKGGIDELSDSVLEPAIQRLVADMNLQNGGRHPLLRRQFVVSMPEYWDVPHVAQQRATDPLLGSLLAIFSPDFLADANICRIIVNYDVEEISPEASSESTKGENQ